MSRARTLRRGAGAALALLASTALTAPARAQTGQTVPQAFNEVDANGVDLITGALNFQLVEASIGSGEGALTLVRYGAGPFGASNWQNMYLTESVSGTTRSATVVLGDVSEHFTSTSGGAYVAARANGATLTRSGGTYTYTAADGTTISFGVPHGGGLEPIEDKGGYSAFCGHAGAEPGGCTALALALAAPNGRTVSFDWEVNADCDMPGGFGDPVDCAYHWRLSRVTNSFGYEIDFSFATNSFHPTNWFQRSGASLSNLNVSGENPLTVAYSYPSSTVTEVTVPSPAGETHVWRITTDSNGRITGIRRPGETNDNVTVTWGTGGVTQVAGDGVTTGYAYSTGSTTVTQIDGDPNTTDPQTVIAHDTSVGRPASVTDPLSRATSFDYDSAGRLTMVTMPEGNSVAYTYDARGNVTETRLREKDDNGDTGDDIVTTAAYPTCTSGPACNRPTSTTDALGNVTDYEWSSTHGGLLKVTLPAPTTGATRSETRYSYAQVTAVTGQPVYQLTEISACSTGTAGTCVGTANESRTVIAYDTVNIRPTSVTRRNGSNTLSAVTAMTYTPYGDVTSVDGPLSGTDDTAHLVYDAARRPVGTISPDPDGSGSAPRRATRTTYRADGQVSSQEMGTVTGTTLSGFTAAQGVAIDYDSNDRPTAQRLVSGSTTYSLTQISYDPLGRPECTALRMNPAEFSSLPTSACTIDTAGDHGPDRITRTVYNAASEATQQLVGVGVLGTSQQGVAVATFGYTANGRLQHLTDGEDNLTTYVYDGFDRLSRTRYPVTTQGAATSSTIDYEELGYDDNGNVTSLRLRDESSIAFAYDALNRMTSKDLPGTELTITYSYDQLSRLTQASNALHPVTMAYDALDRVVSETSYYGTKSMGYDAAGRMTSLTYPGAVPSGHPAFSVGYVYNPAGDMTEVRERPATTNFLIASFGYDSVGRRSSLSRGNGLTTSYGYDAVSRLASLAHDASGSTHDLTLEFGYNPAHQIVETERSNAVYSYTAAANMNRVDTHNGLNQILETGTTDIDHDARGNVTDDGPRTFTYNAENRLIHSGGPDNFWLHHDPLGRAFNFQAPSLHETPDWVGWTMVAEADQNANVRRRYVHGPGIDEPLVWYEGTGTSDRRWLIQDERGSVVGVASDAGAVTNVNTYDEYGIPGNALSGRFGYTGQAWIPQIGLYYYRNRMYHPTLGRFMQPDPIEHEGGMNIYAYVGNDPINFVDPFGLCPQGEVPRWLPYTPQEATQNEEDDGFTITAPPMICIPIGPTNLDWLVPILADLSDPPPPDRVQCPVRTPARIGSRFGPRRRPTRGASTIHNGQDFPQGLGAPVYAAQSGRVSSVFRHRSGGNSIIMRNSDGSRNGYGHTAPIPGIRPGVSVPAGQQIGRTDLSGVTTGPHLHFTFTPSGSANKVNPLVQVGSACR